MTTAPPTEALIADMREFLAVDQRQRELREATRDRSAPIRHALGMYREVLMDHMTNHSIDDVIIGSADKNDARKGIQVLQRRTCRSKRAITDGVIRKAWASALSRHSFAAAVGGDAPVQQAFVLALIAAVRDLTTVVRVYADVVTLSSKRMHNASQHPDQLASTDGAPDPMTPELLEVVTLMQSAKADLRDQSIATRLESATLQNRRATLEAQIDAALGPGRCAVAIPAPPGDAAMAGSERLPRLGRRLRVQKAKITLPVLDATLARLMAADDADEDRVLQSLLQELRTYSIEHARTHECLSLMRPRRSRRTREALKSDLSPVGSDVRGTGDNPRC